MSSILLKSLVFSSKVFEKTMLKRQLFQSEDIFQCRICAEGKGTVPIFENTYVRNIPEEIENITGVTIKRMENISNNMCTGCLNLLNNSVLFREMCQKSSQRIKEMCQVDKREKTHELSLFQLDDNYDDLVFNNSSLIKIKGVEADVIICEACRQAFHDMASYGRHRCEKPKIRIKGKRVRKIKGQRKKILCNICGHVTFCNALLKIHMNVHQNLFPFKCDKCPYKSSSMSLLRVHIRVHSEEKAYKCSQCTFATKTSGNLSKHIRHRHTDSRPFKCQSCDKQFAFQHEVNQHVKRIHLRETVGCEICHKHFSTRKNLLKHRRIIHKISRTEKHGRVPSYLRVALEEENENNDREFLQS